jgi:hypothetical protein
MATAQALRQVFIHTVKIGGILVFFVIGHGK